MKIFLSILWATLALTHAQTSKELLRDGLFAEESEGDFKTATEKYQTLLAAFEKERKVAAVALYRLAAVKRKQGDEKAALALYQEFATKFADIEPQSTMVKENYLALSGKPLATGQASPNEEEQELAKLKRLRETSPDLFPDFTEYYNYVQKGWLKPVSYLLELGADPNKDDALRRAAAGGNLAMTNLLINAGAAKNHRLRDQALFHSLIEKRWTIAELLREKGATLEKENPDALLDFAKDNLPSEKITLIVDYGADPNWIGKSINPKNRNSTSDPIKSSLHYNVAKQDHRFVKNLLKVGTRVDLAREYDKIQAIHFAAFLGDAKMMTILIEAGADPNALCDLPEKSYIVLADRSFPSSPQTPIDLAPVNSIPVLLKAGAKVTPASFHKAVTSKNLALVQQMLSLGADPNSKLNGENISTPLNTALKQKDAPMVTLLLKNGANFRDANWAFLNSAQRIDFARRFIYPELHEAKNLSLVFPEKYQPSLKRHQIIEVGPRTLSNLLDAKFPIIFSDTEKIINLGELTWTLFRKGKATQVDLSKSPLPDFRDGDILEVTEFAPNEILLTGPNFNNLRFHPSQKIPLNLLKATRFPFKLTVEGKSWEMQVCPDKLLYDLNSKNVPDVSIAKLADLIERNTTPQSNRGNRSIIIHRKGFPSITLGRHDSSLDQLRLFPDAHLEFPATDTALKTQIRSSSISAYEANSPGYWRWSAGDQAIMVRKQYPGGRGSQSLDTIKRNPSLLQILTDLNESYSPSVLNENVLPEEIATKTFSKINLDEILIHRLSSEGEQVITIHLNQKIEEWHESGKKTVPFDLPLEAGDIVKFTSRKEGLPGFSDRTHQYLQTALATSLLFQTNDLEPVIRKLDYHQAQWNETPYGLFPIKPQTGLTSVRGDYLTQQPNSILELRIDSKSIQLRDGMTYWPKDGDFLINKTRSSRPRPRVVPSTPQPGPPTPTPTSR